ncbi:MAG: DUF89 family protein [Fidelibacterota bacterium]|nr:MAG: DUF89 family protein [Candidatus Neomarinimicrobiota bacterium]
MRSDPECLVCILKQSLNTARIITSDINLLRTIIDQTAEQILRSDLALTPAALSKPVYEIVAGVTGTKDPFRELKHRTNLEALQLLPELEANIADADDPLSIALHLAVAGNIIDLGIGHDFDLINDIKAILNTEFAVDDTEDFRRDLQPGRQLLFLGDNSGEIVFDRILVQELVGRGLAVTYCVKSGPIINDATMEDALQAGLTEMVPVIETGSNDIGVDFNRISSEFEAAFNRADIIIAKGQGNFETCDDASGNIYFLLKAKCDVVARELGVTTGDIVFTHSPA